MIPLIASEETFVSSTINGSLGSSKLNFKYALAQDEYENILKSVLLSSASTSQAQILTGMIRDQALVPIKVADLSPKHPVGFQNARPEYIELSIMCMRNFIHALSLTPHDEQVFNSFQITLHQANNVNYNNINGAHTSNVVASWNLNEGGHDLLSQHAAGQLLFSSNIKIYDRYFSNHSLSSVAEMFAVYFAANGTYSGSVSIYYGAKLLGSLNVPTIISTLSPYIDPSNIHVLKCTKPSSSLNHAHDRYMQIDNRHTFQFTAGIGCYCESNGLNRASTVMLKSIISKPSFVDILDENNIVVRISF